MTKSPNFYAVVACAIFIGGLVLGLLLGRSEPTHAAAAAAAAPVTPAPVAATSVSTHSELLTFTAVPLDICHHVGNCEHSESCAGHEPAFAHKYVLVESNVIAASAGPIIVCAWAYEH